MVATTELTVRLRPRHKAQAQIVREAKRFNVLQCGRRFGKTTLGVDLALDKALDRQPVGWFAPTYKLLDEAWRDVQRASREAIVTVDKQQRRFEFVGGGAMEFWTLDHPDPGRGRKYARVIVDEAGIVRDLDAIWTQAIRATLTDLRGDAWFLGTPKGRNYFHTLYVRGQNKEPNWASWRFATIANPHISAAEVEDARRELPDLAFRQEFLGEPVDDAGNPFGISAIAACVAPLSTAPVVAIGQDLAKSVDWNVTLGLDVDGRTALFDRWQGPWETTETRILGHLKGVHALVDSTGVGDPIVERLQKGRGNVEGFKFTGPSKQQLMEGLAVAIQQRRVTFPDGPIRLELEAFQYEFTRTGVRYEAPPGMHDDCVIALALAHKLASRPKAPPPRYAVGTRTGIISG